MFYKKNNFNQYPLSYNKLPMMNYSRSQNSVATSPKLEEWAMISKHRALEQQRMKQLQKMEQHYKKMKFKHDLDEQLSKKNNSHLEDQRADQKYYQYIVNKAHEQQEKQLQEKMDKLRKRIQVQEDNKHIIEAHRNSRLSENRPDYQLDIGIKSEQEQKFREEVGKKEMLSALERQVREKRQRSLQSKLEDYRKDQKHFQTEDDIFNHGPEKDRNKNKSFKQNEQVYHYYEHLLEEKRSKQKELQRKYIEDAARRKSDQQKKRKFIDDMKREEMTNSMKQTLDEQVKIYNYKKHSEKNVNPEDMSFGFIQNVFREHPPAYDKNKYYEELRMQAQEQKQRKRQANFMTDEEYRFNRNQLNKIVTGEYAYNKYVDRSLGAIGQKSFSKPILQDENSMIVKSRLDSLQNRKGSYFNPLQQSYN